MILPCCWDQAARGAYLSFKMLQENLKCIKKSGRKIRRTQQTELSEMHHSRWWNCFNTQIFNISSKLPSIFLLYYISSQHDVKIAYLFENRSVNYLFRTLSSSTGNTASADNVITSSYFRKQFFSSSSVFFHRIHLLLHFLSEYLNLFFKLRLI